MHQLLHHRAHVLQGQVRPARSHQPPILPDREIIRAAITGIAGGQIKDNITAVGRCGQFEACLMLGGKRHHRFLPAFRAVLLANVAHTGEPPQGLLPGFNVRCRQRAGAELRPQAIKQRRGVGARECLAQRGEVFGIQPVRTAFALEGREIFGHRQPATGVGIKRHPLQIHRHSPAGFREAAVEFPDPR